MNQLMPTLDDSKPNWLIDRGIRQLVPWHHSSGKENT